MKIQLDKTHLATLLKLVRTTGVLAFFVLCTFSLNARADSDDHSGWVGGLFGLTVPNASNTSSRAIYGLTAGAMLGTEYGIGAYYESSSKDESANGITFPFNYDLYGVEFTYNFEGEAKGVYFGGRIGTSKVKEGNFTESPMNIGVLAGFNHWLASSLSLGGEVSFTSVSGGSDISGFTTLNFLASLKFWF